MRHYEAAHAAHVRELAEMRKEILLAKSMRAARAVAHAARIAGAQRHELLARTGSGAEVMRYVDNLEKALALDAVNCTSHHADAVIRAMLQAAHQIARANAGTTRRAIASQAGRNAGRQGGSGGTAKKASVAPLTKSAAVDRKIQSAAGTPEVQDDAKVRAAAALGGGMSLAEMEAAVDAAVVAGKISGQEAVALQKRIRAKG